MQHIVAVIVPLRGEALGQQAGAIVLVLQHQMHMATGFHGGLHALGQFGEEAAVGNGMHGIEAQPVEAVVHQPHQRVVDEEVADFAAAEIDAIAPGRLLVVAEEVFGVAAEVIAVRAEVVVDHIEKHHQAEAVGGIDQMLELFRTAIGRFRRVGQDAVVTPVAVAGKLGDRHQLDGRHAEVGKPGEVLFHLGETAIQTDMGFVQHRLVPGTTEPAAVAPQIVVMGIDHQARRMHVTRLRPRGGVGHMQFVVDEKPVERTGPVRGIDAVPAFFSGGHRQRLCAYNDQTDVMRIGRPESEAGGPVFQQLWPVMPDMGTLLLH